MDSSETGETSTPLALSATSSGDLSPVNGTAPPTAADGGDPLLVSAAMTALYVAILAAGLVGNVSTCAVIARSRHLHTATNYYLFSLAISDLLLLVSGLPHELYNMWVQPYALGQAVCVLQGFAAETSANASVLTITAFTVERYVAICHPFQARGLSQLSRAVKLVIAVWCVALCLAVPQVTPLLLSTSG
ncbi:pyrokinin-1 receptor-like [Schistocerca cancellata]|uniref:pyrokinin-1 receptor-like n=1 Tax=Schistocerca cancellata TaxID=274614 RepID=UPI0021174C73|nr:pyrokinin-1 receptor-like [Schistocerca cancellata]